MSYLFVWNYYRGQKTVMLLMIGKGNGVFIVELRRQTRIPDNVLAIYWHLHAFEIFSLYR